MEWDWSSPPRVVRAAPRVQSSRPTSVWVRSSRSAPPPARSGANASHRAAEPAGPTWFHYQIDATRHWLDVSRPGELPISEQGSPPLLDSGILYAGAPRACHPDYDANRADDGRRRSLPSSDGQFSFIVDREGFSLYDAGAGELVRYDGTPPLQRQWHPSEPRIAYIDDASPDETGILTLLDARSRTRSRWMSGAWELSWSPDGRYLAVVRDAGWLEPCAMDLLILDARGTSEPALWVSCGVFGARGIPVMRWSGDSSWLVYRQRQPALFGALQLKTGRHYELVGFDADAYQWDITSDLVMADDWGQHVAVASLRSPPSITKLAAPIYSPRLSPEGPFFTACDDESQVLIDSRRPQTGYRVGDGRVSQFSPDGRWLAYSDNYRLYVRRVGNPPGAAQFVTVWEEPLAVRSSSLAGGLGLNALWGPRGEQFVFARRINGQVQLELASMQRGWQPIVLAAHPGDNIGWRYWRPPSFAGVPPGAGGVDYGW